ncbi:hypothetical protein H8356DRAFT_1086921 [Neocallimastix lanati (nom. inval.)]|uniref:Uncharacterized protein n=1 Tax=Neocallimastix californiae TaxID=1754190 RepID=A0A1Y2CKM3_9FUNG|nr:hypothetical protein H8356DRAFT_1086921 [Neocallimastix sp. JGI-2020a]ORY47562.1 hypothetical protein LY90DRAFT_509058 [Neocallimastix californiae]|eukprot:ORY47562.1 hypothetical protein LY90DRAFT_509058 [Neocallimastix californiae]
MNCIYPILYYILFIPLLGILKVTAKDIYIDNKNYYDLKNIINRNQENDVLKIFFVDDHYDMTIFPHSTDITITTNVIMSGKKNGTIFDYKNDGKGRLVFSFTNNNKNPILKFENIIFENYNPSGITN